MTKEERADFERGHRDVMRGVDARGKPHSKFYWEGCREGLLRGPTHRNKGPAVITAVVFLDAIAGYFWLVAGGLMESLIVISLSAIIIAVLVFVPHDPWRLP